MNFQVLFTISLIFSSQLAFATLGKVTAKMVKEKSGVSKVHKKGDRLEDLVELVTTARKDDGRIEVTRKIHEAGSKPRKAVELYERKIDGNSEVPVLLSVKEEIRYLAPEETVVRAMTLDKKAITLNEAGKNVMSVPLTRIDDLSTVISYRSGLNFIEVLYFNTKGRQVTQYFHFDYRDGKMVIDPNNHKPVAAKASEMERFPMNGGIVSSVTSAPSTQSSRIVMPAAAGVH